MSARSRALREKKAALRAELARKRAALRQQLPARPDRTRQRRRRRNLIGLLLALLAILLMMQNCTCAPAPEPQKSAMHPGPGESSPPEPPKRSWSGRLSRQGRPTFTPPAQQPLTWIDRYRMQVAARSPRLAACFVGATRPGTLKWSAAVSPQEGTVSAHTLETTLGSDPLSREQRACVLEALSTPPYQLGVDDGGSAPSRVSMVIEF